MPEISVHEISEVGRCGIVALPRHNDVLHGHVEKRPQAPRIVGGYLQLSKGKMPWTPAWKLAGRNVT